MQTLDFLAPVCYNASVILQRVTFLCNKLIPTTYVEISYFQERRSILCNSLPRL